jgi:hypothetical protein
MKLEKGTVKQEASSEVLIQSSFSESTNYKDSPCSIYLEYIHHRKVNRFNPFLCWLIRLNIYIHRVIYGALLGN